MIKETYSVEAEYLWDGETHAVFRHPVSNKWFEIIMEVKKKIFIFWAMKKAMKVKMLLT